MCEQFVGFVARLPKGHEMPPGYHLEGITGENGADGRCVTYYYWCRDDLSLDGVGPDETDKRKCVRQAWRHFRNG